MDDIPGDVDLDALPVRPVRRARMLISLSEGARQRVAVLDGEAGHWVLVPALHDAARPPALSPDGAAVALLSGPYPHRLVWHNLETGQRQELPQQRWVFDHAVAVSPDGRTVATMATGPEHSDADGVVAVDLVDLIGGQRRRLWQGPGGWVAESAVAFSADGDLAAATYNDSNDEFATVVLDRAGSTVRRYPYACLPLGAGIAWSSADRLLLTDDGDGTVVLVDVRSGVRRVLDHHTVPPLGVWNGDVIYDAADGTGVALADSTTGHRRPFLAVRPSASIVGFHAVRHCAAG